MKKILLFFLPIVLAVIVFAGIILIIAKQTPLKGALQVTSVPQSTVYLNGASIGKTPLCKCEGKDMLPAGSYTIKLVPTDTTKEPFETTIAINSSVLTVVDRTFGDVSNSSGSVITLTQTPESKKAQLFITSFPTGATVSLDSNAVGESPLALQSITDSDHEIALAKDGYQQKTVRVHGVAGYKLQAVIWLGTNITSQITQQATQSATAQPSVSPTPTPIKSGPTTGSPQITILQTPTGFLRVRDSASISGQEIAQVHPGDVLPLVGEQDGWYQIKMTNGQIGWVSASYAKKQ